MILTINPDNHGKSYVLDEQKNAHYMISVTDTPEFLATVSDELGLNTLVGLQLAQNGYDLSIFGTPAGVFTIGNKENTDEYYFCRIQNSLWEIEKSADSYVVMRDGETTANIISEGRNIKIDTDEENQLILVIASALIIMAENAKAAAASKGALKKKHKADFNLKVPKIQLGKLLSYTRFAIKGRQAIVLFAAMGLCIILAVTGIVVSAVNRDSGADLKETYATVYTSEKPTKARFSVNGYYYDITISGYKYYQGDQFKILYTQNEKGQLKNYYMSKPGSGGFVALAVVSVILLLLLIVYFVFGKPININAIKRLAASKSNSGKSPKSKTAANAEALENTEDENDDVDLSDINNND